MTRRDGGSLVPRFCNGEALVFSWTSSFGVPWLEERLDALLHDLSTPARPPRLCHYTTWRGLEGILTTRQIWAVDFRRQETDAAEFRHAEATISSFAANLASTLLGPERELFSRFAATYSTASVDKIAGDDVFIACFCEDSTNSHLWQQFACDSTGYALEIVVLGEILPLADVATFLAPVVYTPDDLNNKLDRAFRSVLDLLGTFGFWRRDRFELARRAAMAALFRIAAVLAPFFKAERYAREHEWRLVVLRANAAALKDDLEPKRHVSLPLRADSSALPAISRILIGNRAPHDAEVKVHALLAQAGYRDEAIPKVLRSPV